MGVAKPKGCGKNTCELFKKGKIMALSKSANTYSRLNWEQSVSINQ